MRTLTHTTLLVTVLPQRRRAGLQVLEALQQVFNRCQWVVQITGRLNTVALEVDHSG